jgi:hypothetical protein
MEATMNTTSMFKNHKVNATSSEKAQRVEAIKKEVDAIVELIDRKAEEQWHKKIDFDRVLNLYEETNKASRILLSGPYICIRFNLNKLKSENWKGTEFTYAGHNIRIELSKDGVWYTVFTKTEDDEMTYLGQINHEDMDGFIESKVKNKAWNQSPIIDMWF